MTGNRPEFRKDFGASKMMGIIFGLRITQLIWTGIAKSNRSQFVYSLLPVEYRNIYTFTIYVIFQSYSSCNMLIMLYFASISIIMLDTIDSLLKTR